MNINNSANMNMNNYTNTNNFVHIKKIQQNLNEYYLLASIIGSISRVMEENVCRNSIYTFKIFRDFDLAELYEF